MPVSTSIIALLVVETINATTSMALMPVLPFYVMQMGANAFDIALQGTVFNLAQMVFAPVVGALSDRIGRKRILIATLLGSAVANFLQAKASSLSEILMVRAVGGIVTSGGPVETAYLMEETSSEDELREVLVLQRLVVTLGAILGPLVAKIFWYWSFQTLCYGMIATNIAGAVIGILFYSEHTPADQGSPRGGSPEGRPEGRPMMERRGSFTQTPKTFSPTAILHGRQASRWWRLLVGRETSILLVGSFVFNFTVGVTEGPEVVFFKDYFGYTQNDMSDLLLVSCIAALVLTPLLPALQTYLGPRQSCVAGCIGIGLTTLLLVLGTGIHWMPELVAGLSVGLFGSMTGLGFMAVVHSVVPMDRLGTFLGIKSFFDGLAGTLSPAVGGFLYTRDHFLPYGLSCGLCAVTAGVFASFAPLQEKPVSKEEVEPMLSKELESDSEAEDEDTGRFLAENLPFSKSSMMVKLMTNELGIMMDEQLKTALYDKFGVQGTEARKKHVSRSNTIGVDNFAASQQSVPARRLRASCTQPEFPEEMSPKTSKSEV